MREGRSEDDTEAEWSWVVEDETVCSPLYFQLDDVLVHHEALHEGTGGGLIPFLNAVAVPFIHY